MCNVDCVSITEQQQKLTTIIFNNTLEMDGCMKCKYSFSLMLWDVNLNQIK